MTRRRLWFRVALLAVTVGITLADHAPNLPYTEVAVAIAEVAVAIASPPLAWWANIVVHELGHLIVAWLMRVPVTGAKVFGYGFTRDGRDMPDRFRHAVYFDPTRLRGPLQALRYAITLAAGPVANLATAAFAVPILFDSTRPAVVRWSAVCVIVVGADLGLRSLFFFRAPPGISRDGQKIARLLLGRSSHTEMLDASTPQEPTATPDTEAAAEELRRQIDTGSPAVAGTAAARLAALAAPSDLDGRLGDVPRIIAAAQRPGMAHADIIEFTSRPSLNIAQDMLQSTISTGASVEPRQLAATAALAEAGYTAGPPTPLARNAFGLTRLLQGHAEEVRQLYIGIGPLTEDPEATAQALAIRALAELKLGNLTAARRLIAAADPLQVVGAGTDLLLRHARASIDEAHSSSEPGA